MKAKNFFYNVKERECDKKIAGRKKRLKVEKNFVPFFK